MPCERDRVTEMMKRLSMPHAQTTVTPPEFWDMLHKMPAIESFHGTQKVRQTGEYLIFKLQALQRKDIARSAKIEHGVGAHAHVRAVPAADLETTSKVCA